MTVNSRAAVLYEACFKLSWQQRILTTNQIFCFPHIERLSYSTQQNSSHFILEMKYLPWSLCCGNHPITCLSSLGYLRVKKPTIARFADILSLPERTVTWFLIQHCIMDSLSPNYLRFFCTVSASTITFILKAIVYQEQCAFGMMRKITGTKELIKWNVCQITTTESIVVFL